MMLQNEFTEFSLSGTYNFGEALVNFQKWG